MLSGPALAKPLQFGRYTVSHTVDHLEPGTGYSFKVPYPTSNMLLISA